ncbi:MAG TPA: nucleoside hydrolase [Gemmatimonadales bacterium]|nr:nucleoside hydrolase [Gemmatimonadales bacterium]
MTPPLPLVLDTDPGIDDTLALLLALASPELDVRAVVTVYGNTTLAHATANARRIAAWAGRGDLAVVAGADRPLLRTLVTARETHGPRGLGWASADAVSEGAVTPDPFALLEVLRTQPAPVTLVTLGPLTNLAHALRREPETVRARVAAHVAMAGSLRARGTQTPLAEFNVWCDPDAAQLVLDAELGTRWVGLDVTRLVTLAARDVEALDRTPRDRWLRDALRFYCEFHRAYESFDGCVVNDPVPIALLLEPDLVDFDDVGLAVDLRDGATRGQTRLDPRGRTARAATAIDANTVRELLFRRVFGAGPDVPPPDPAPPTLRSPA